MADFPAIEPDTRSWSFGAFSMSAVSGVGGGAIRFSHSTTGLGHQLTLGFVNLSDADASLIRLHYRGQQGGVLSFFLPDVIWLGHASPTDVVPATSRWKYQGDPQETSKGGGLFDVSVQLQHVGAEPP